MGIAIKTHEAPLYLYREIEIATKRIDAWECKRKVQGVLGAHEGEGQATGKRPARGMSTTPHKVGLWGSEVNRTMHNGNENVRVHESDAMATKPWNNEPR